MKRIGAIYHLDNQLSDLEPDDRKKQRQMTVKPLVEAFFAWVKEIQSSNRLPKGKTLEGINYCINQEEALKVFLNDGEVPLDNNVTEGALRSFCLHKHAWKLIDSIDGAKSSAIIYSITETAKANNLNPFRYLDHVLTVLKDHQDDTDYSFIEKLLPWSGQLPEICGASQKQPMCKPGRRKRRSKNEPVLMVYRVLYNMADTYFVGMMNDPVENAAVSLCLAGTVRLMR